MKLEVEIPEWAVERHIRIMAGVEVLAYKPYGENILYVKETRCVMCGKCCTELPNNFFFPVVDGTCVYLNGDEHYKVRECTLINSRPFVCASSITNKELEHRPYCSITYRKVKI